MYPSFYGLREHPFDLTPNPKYMFLSRGHREALANVKYGITGRKGVTMLTGEAGTGKTTVVRAALATLSDEYKPCVHVTNPTLTRAEFYELLAATFSMTEQAAHSKARFLIELHRLVEEHQARGQITALVVDEAHKLPSELMEEVRLLANLETATRKLLPVVLVGQPELGERLERPELRQLKQRVSLRCHLRPLDLQETCAFIAGRIRIAGGHVAQVFARDAVLAIFEHSGGVPRTISVICDNALITGFAADTKPIGPAIILDVCRDFRLTRVAPQIEGDGPDRATRFPTSSADVPDRRVEKPSGPVRDRVSVPLARPAYVPSEMSGRTRIATAAGASSRRETGEAVPMAVTPPPVVTVRAGVPSAPAGQNTRSATPERPPAPPLFTAYTRRRRFLFF